MPDLFHSAAVPDWFRGKGSSRRNPIRLTPLIDVVFILLIFFMLASNYEDWHAIPVDAPVEAGISIDSEPDALLIEIGPDRLRLSAETISQDILIARLGKLLLDNPNLVVLIKPVDGVLLQEAVSLMDRLSEAGIGRMSLIR
ncbi:MAG: biopolymer transporter ExbD [Gammaproteobacteria bacterium]|nr:biopolymer transporter ExbD [Gammaproteobacteria bacterium]MCY4227371.1 biopolymer transporter ExbD [Gammaproteobacteria bacterium]MCY4313366.1 biopolymer transporter ExbD [Gammaproteobacteria bacterium]